MAGKPLNCPAGQEASTTVAIWHEDMAIHVVLAGSPVKIPETGVLYATVAELMAEGLMQRTDALHVAITGESQN